MNCWPLQDSIDNILDNLIEPEINIQSGEILIQRSYCERNINFALPHRAHKMIKKIKPDPSSNNYEIDDDPSTLLQHYFPDADVTMLPKSIEATSPVLRQISDALYEKWVCKRYKMFRKNNLWASCCSAVVSAKRKTLHDHPMLVTFATLSSQGWLRSPDTFFRLILGEKKPDNEENLLNQVKVRIPLPNISHPGLISDKLRIEELKLVTDDLNSDLSKASQRILCIEMERSKLQAEVQRLTEMNNNLRKEIERQKKKQEFYCPDCLDKRVQGEFMNSDEEIKMELKFSRMKQKSRLESLISYK